MKEMKVSTLLRFVVALCFIFLVVSPPISAGVIFDRPYVPGSTTTWTSTGAYILGDDFTLGANGTIDSLSVWFVAHTGTTNPNQEASSIKLFAGADPGPLPLLSSTYSFTSAGIFANPTLKIDQPIFLLTFSGLNWSANGGTLYDFGIEGTIIGAASGQPFYPFNLTATNPLNATTPGPGDGADGFLLAFDGTAGTGPYNLFFTNPGSSTDPLVGDINVQISGSTIPEPSTFAMLGLGAGVLLVFRRRRN
jgi:hypothetical protein